MKKFLFSFLIVAFIFMISTTGIFAQYRSSSPGHDMKFVIGTGVEVDDGFNEIFYAVGVELDIPLSDTLMLTPEFTLKYWEWSFDLVWLHPGATINYLFGRPSGVQIFLGGGLLHSIILEPSGGEGYLQFKANVGVITDEVKLTLYMYTPFDDFFGALQFGIWAGWRF